MPSTINASTTLGLVNSADTSGVLQLQTANTTAVTIDASQNVSLAVGTANGVTYLNGSKVLTSGSTLSTDGTNLALGGSATAFGSNVSTLLLKGTGATTTKVGAVYFKDASSADAGAFFLQDDSTYGFTSWNAMATGNFFRWAIGALGTETMRLTSTGLGIGTSSPAYKINVVEGKTLTPTTGDGQIAIDNSTSGQVSAILFSSQGTRRAQISAGLGGTGNDGYLAFTTRNDTTGFGERARIDSSGNFLVNDTTNTGTSKMLVVSDTNSFNIFTIKDTNATTYNSTKFYQQFLNSSNSVAGSIQHTASTTVAYSTSSDERLKENIVDAPNALNKLSGIQVRSYVWKEDKAQVEYGFVAQELAQIYSEAVGVGGDDEKTNPWNIEYGRLTPLLVKAIQEQQAIIQQLQADVAALKG